MSKMHPVYDVYDFQRTACLNVKYYGRRLGKLERQNFWVEGVLAIAAPGSAIAGMWFLESEYGQVAWKLLTVIAAIVAIIKPFLKFSSKIKKYESVLSGYRALMSDVEELIHQIKVEGEYSKASKKIFENSLKKKRVLLQNSPESNGDKALVEICMVEVNNEIPHTNFFIPEK